MREHQARSQIEAAEKCPSLDMSKVPSSKLSKLSNVQLVDNLHRSLERGGGSIPETEALEFSRQFEREFDICAEDIRPCIASFYYQGVVSDREPYGFILVLELQSLGIDADTIEDALRAYSSRLGRTLTNAEIIKHRRKSENGRYNKPYGCKRAELIFFCIGDICPWKRLRKGEANKGPIFSTFFSLNWPATLKDPFAVTLYFGLHNLRQMKSLPPNKEFRFNYQRMEKLTGLNPARITERLKKLKEVGLIADLTVGSMWGSGRARTRVTLAWPIPEPKFGGEYF